EEDHGQRDDDAAPVAGQSDVEGAGGEGGGLVLSGVVPHPGDDDGQGGDADHDERVDEGLGHRDQGLADRVAALGGGGRDAAGAEARLVGEDAAGDAVLDRGGHPGSEEPADGGGAGEGVGEDELH